ncbi:MAG: exosortase A, partial [Casimicrobiaceae bacterium]
FNGTMESLPHVEIGMPPATRTSPPPGAAVLPTAPPAARDPVADSWVTAPVVAATAAVAGVIAVHSVTAASIVAIWMRSETFAHGFLVVPICLWLVWRKRQTLAATPAAPWWPGLLVVLAAGGMWLVMRVADVLGLAQFALAFMVEAAIVTVVGLRVARALAFPLAFVLFAIPVGEIFVPTLIDWTADFTIGALRLSGVPVYREANQFVIPSGVWSVVEACSGIRYIIASVMVGTIYAAVAYRSPRRRAAFVLAAILAPIVANWLRAYLIVMLGHFSNNTLAVGVDHVIYGWLFFGLVMLLLFWIGSFWQEPAAAPIRTGTGIGIACGARAAAIGSIPKLGAAALGCIVAAALWVPLEARVDRADAAAPLGAVVPVAANGWEVSGREIAPWRPHYRGFAWDLQQTYRKEGREVGVYLAFYRNQTKGSELITSGNQLATMEDFRWKAMARATETIDWNGAGVAAEFTRLAGPAVTLDMVRLFWMDGQVTGSEYVAKARMAWSKLSGHGDDAALIVIYAPRGAAPAESGESLRAFARDMSTSIQDALTAARSSSR